MYTCLPKTIRHTYDKSTFYAKSFKHTVKKCLLLPSHGFIDHKWWLHSMSPFRFKWRIIKFLNLKLRRTWMTSMGSEKCVILSTVYFILNRWSEEEKTQEEGTRGLVNGINQGYNKRKYSYLSTLSWLYNRSIASRIYKIIGIEWLEYLFFVAYFIRNIVQHITRNTVTYRYVCTFEMLTGQWKYARHSNGTVMAHPLTLVCDMACLINRQTEPLIPCVYICYSCWTAR